MTDLQDALTETLEPLVRKLVREEIERAKLQWRWLTVRQAAEVLDVTPGAVYQRIHVGQLPHRKMEGRVYVDMEKLAAMIERS